MATVTVMHALPLEITKSTHTHARKEIRTFFAVVVDGLNGIECALANSNFHLIVSLKRLTSIAKSIGSMPNSIPYRLAMPAK